MKDYLQRKKKTKLAAELLNSNTGNNKIVESLQIWGEMSLISQCTIVFPTKLFFKNNEKKTFHTETEFYEKKFLRVIQKEKKGFQQEGLRYREE